MSASFWQHELLFAGGWIAIVLFAASCMRRLWPRSPVPDSLLAGLLAFVIGPSVLHWAAFDPRAMEAITYHGLALVFIGVGLQPVDSTRPTRDARMLAFAMPGMAVLQGMVGLAVVLLWWWGSGEVLHPGFGLLLPLGFQQGPGQALSIGAALEADGLVDGGAIGLIVAAIGFGHCLIFGVPLVWLARRKGWITPLAAPVEETLENHESANAVGALDPLSWIVATMGCIYATVYATLSVVGGQLPTQRAEAMLWGLHFVLAGVFAIVVRRMLTRVSSRAPWHPDLLSRCVALTVDVATVAALAGVRADVLARWFAPVFIMTTLGGIATVAACVWLRKRGFSQAAFEHVLVLVGACTGTLPTGLALLRLVDPQLRSSVPRNVVLASGWSVILGVPLLVVVLPLTVAGWPLSFPLPVWRGLGSLACYLAALWLGARWFAGFRTRRGAAPWRGTMPP